MFAIISDTHVEFVTTPHGNNHYHLSPSYTFNSSIWNKGKRISGADNMAFNVIFDLHYEN